MPGSELFDLQVDDTTDLPRDKGHRQNEYPTVPTGLDLSTSSESSDHNKYRSEQTESLVIIPYDHTESSDSSDPSDDERSYDDTNSFDSFDEENIYDHTEFCEYSDDDSIYEEDGLDEDDSIYEEDDLDEDEEEYEEPFTINRNLDLDNM
jgi:hypothetical protein